jgi:hypothetical protein
MSTRCVFIAHSRSAIDLVADWAKGAAFEIVGLGCAEFSRRTRAAGYKGAFMREEMDCFDGERKLGVQPGFILVILKRQADQQWQKV